LRSLLEEGGKKPMFASGAAEMTCLPAQGGTERGGVSRLTKELYTRKKRVSGRVRSLLNTNNPNINIKREELIREWEAEAFMRVTHFL